MSSTPVSCPCVLPFLIFLPAFTFLLCSRARALHPHLFADKLAAMLLAGFLAPLALVRNWTFALFYIAAEMWGSVVVGLLFWSFANEVTMVDEAKKYHPHPHPPLRPRG